MQHILGKDVTAQIARRSKLHAFKGNTPALDSGAQLRLAGEKQQTMEKLRATAEYQPATRLSGFPDSIAQETLNRLQKTVPVSKNACALPAKILLDRCPHKTGTGQAAAYSKAKQFTACRADCG